MIEVAENRDRTGPPAGVIRWNGSETSFRGWIELLRAVEVALGTPRSAQWPRDRGLPQGRKPAR